MHNKQEVKEQLKQYAKNQIFEKEFRYAVEKELAERRRTADHIHKQEEILTKEAKDFEEPKVFTIDGDD